MNVIGFIKTFVDKNMLKNKKYFAAILKLLFWNECKMINILIGQ